MKGILFTFLTAFFAWSNGQQKPQVTMFPKFKQVYSGDTLVLKCPGSGQLKWFFNSNPMQDQIQASDTRTINIISKKDSGSYHCERGGERSDAINVTVLEGLPFASLSINSGIAVINTGDSVVLKLHVDTGLKNWTCFVYKGGKTKRIIIDRTLMTSDSMDVDFHPKTVEKTESPALYWCEHKTEMKRTNPITVKITDQMVMLETPPEPAILGKVLILSCRVWGEPVISNAIFYKNGEEKLNEINSVMVIQNVKIEDQGNYTCRATYKFKKNTSNIPNTATSDVQQLLVKAQPPEAVYNKTQSGLRCSCPDCTKQHRYRWYMYQNQRLIRWEDHQDIGVHDGEKISYRCRAMWNDGVSAPSATYTRQGPSPPSPPVKGIGIGIVILVIIGGVSCVIFYCMKKKRQSRAMFQDDAGYEEVGQRNAADNFKMQEKMKEEKGVDSQYETLQQSENEGVYHTLGAEGGKGTEGGYEALKKSKTDEKEGVYHTLGAEGGKGTEGGYEALKKSKTDEKEGEYQTLKSEEGKGEEENTL